MKRKILHSSKWLLAFFTLLALFISCRKNEVVGPAKERSKEELQKMFFNTSTTNDAEIQKLAANIQKQKFLLNSLPEFVRKNGIPKWDKVLYKTQQTASGQQTLKNSSNSLKTNTVSSNGANQGVFFIPLQDENSKQVKSYITAYKHNDSLYTYRLYNKDSLNAIRPGSNTTKSNLLNTQAVFGYFEKTINNTDSVNVLSPTKATIKNVKINFDNPTNTNSVNGIGIKLLSGDGCLVAMSVSIEYTLTIWSDGSYSESVSVSMSIAFDCSGGGGGGSGDFGDGSTTYQTPNGGNYWWSYGTGWPYNTGGGGYNTNDPNYNYAGGPSGYIDPNWYWWWTSNPALTTVQNFASTLSPTEFNFWNDPSNFVFVTALTDKLNQENFSAQVQDFVKWAIDYLINNPTVNFQDFYNQFLTPVEGPEEATDVAFWDDSNNTFSRQNLPTMAAFQAAFPKRSDSRYRTSSQLYNSIGGDVLAKVGNHDGINTCAARVSKALNYSGITIPYIPGKTFQGSDGKYYFLGAENLNRWMRKTFGCANPNTAIGEYFNSNSVHYDVSQIGFYGSNLPKLLSGIQGIYSMVSNDYNWATGHATLMDLTNGCDGGCDFNGPVKYIDVWKLQ